MVAASLPGRQPLIALWSPRGGVSAVGICSACRRADPAALSFLGLAVAVPYALRRRDPRPAQVVDLWRRSTDAARHPARPAVAGAPHRARPAPPHWSWRSRPCSAPSTTASSTRPTAPSASSAATPGWSRPGVGSVHLQLPDGRRHGVGARGRRKPGRDSGRGLPPLGRGNRARVHGRQRHCLCADGVVAPSMVTGRAPQNVGEAAVDAQLGVDVGHVMTLAGRGSTSSVRSAG